MKNILVFGRSGQLARALNHSARAAGCAVHHIGRDRLDLAVDPKTAGKAIAAAGNIDLVINASAYTSVDGAETDMETARNLNCRAPEAMAAACRQGGIAFLHMSTDYVFQGGADLPYKPNDPLSPLNTYGQSKAEGEAAVMAANPDSAIFRTSWLYDGVGENFLMTMLRTATRHDELPVVDDQIGRPTYAPHLADALIVAAEQITSENQTGSYSGIYHISGEGAPVSWFGFASEIFRLAGEFTKTPSKLVPVPSDAFKRAAKRPAYSVLDNSHFRDMFGYTMPEWKKGVIDALAVVKSRL